MTKGIGEQELLRRIAELPREVSPERDPWAEIAARIGQNDRQAGRSKRPTQWRLLAVAASVTLALAVGWLLAPEFSAPPAPTGQTEWAAGEPGPEPLSGLRASVRASEAEYQAAFREFIPVGSARTSLSPQTVALIETSWDDLRRTEAELAAALAIRPNDAFLNDRMLELRARQLGFLQRLAALDLNDRRITI
ncbi:MAG: hypothetical protein ACSLE2_11215 [Lysobacterales bacterium]